MSSVSEQKMVVSLPKTVRADLSKQAHAEPNAWFSGPDCHLCFLVTVLLTSPDSKHVLFKLGGGNTRVEEGFCHCGQPTAHNTAPA